MLPSEARVQSMDTRRTAHSIDPKLILAKYSRSGAPNGGLRCLPAPSELTYEMPRR
jgi:hypothetical protein